MYLKMLSQWGFDSSGGGNLIREDLNNGYFRYYLYFSISSGIIAGIGTLTSAYENSIPPNYEYPAITTFWTDVAIGIHSGAGVNFATFIYIGV